MSRWFIKARGMLDSLDEAAATAGPKNGNLADVCHLLS
jgi:hypothetical protein